MISLRPSPTFSAKNILSTVLSYIAVIALILSLIVMLPCIVRTLQQSTQNLSTEIHLAVLKNKKGGDARSHYGSVAGRGNPSRARNWALV